MFCQVPNFHENALTCFLILELSGIKQEVTCFDNCEGLVRPPL